MFHFSPGAPGKSLVCGRGVWLCYLRSDTLCTTSRKKPRVKVLLRVEVIAHATPFWEARDWVWHHQHMVGSCLWHTTHELVAHNKKKNSCPSMMCEQEKKELYNRQQFSTFEINYRLHKYAGINREKHKITIRLRENKTNTPVFAT